MCSVCTSVVANAFCSFWGLMPGGSACGVNIVLVLLVAALAFSLESATTDVVIGGVRSPFSTSADASCQSQYVGGVVICCADVCTGRNAALRCSAALFGFFVLQALLTLPWSTFAAYIHRGLWPIKVSTLLALLAATLWVGNDALLVYGEVCRWVALGFLCLQSLLLIGFANDWNQAWVELDGNYEGLCGFKGALLAVAVAAYSASAAMIVWMSRSLQSKECDAQASLLWLTGLSNAGLTVFGLTSRICPHANLLTSAFVTMFTTYLCWSALIAQPAAACKPASSLNGSIDVAVGALLASLALISAANAASASTDSSAYGAASDGAPPHELARESVPPRPESWGKFHVRCRLWIPGPLMKRVCPSLPCLPLLPQGSRDRNLSLQATMALGALYLAMLLTGWAAAPLPSSEPGGAVAVGLKAPAPSGDLWLRASPLLGSLLLYLFVLVAPWLLRDYRDFGIEFDD